MYVDQGRLDDAAVLLRRAIREFRAAGLSMHETYARATLALCHARIGDDPTAAAADAAIVLGRAEEVGASYALAVATNAHLEAALRAGVAVDVERARRRVANAGDPTLEARLERLVAVEAFGDGRRADAERCLAASLETAQRSGARAELLFTFEAADLMGLAIAPTVHLDVLAAMGDELGVVHSGMDSLLAAAAR